MAVAIAAAMTNPAIQVSVQNMDPTRTLFIDSPEDPHSAATVREIAPGASAYIPLREGTNIRLGSSAFETRDRAQANAGRVEAPAPVKQNPAVGDRVPVPPEPIGASQQVQTQAPVQSQTPRRTQPPQRRQSGNSA
jgi:hypothetical protein